MAKAQSVWWYVLRAFYLRPLYDDRHAGRHDRNAWFAVVAITHGLGPSALIGAILATIVVSINSALHSQYIWVPPCVLLILFLLAVLVSLRVPRFVQNRIDRFILEASPQERVAASSLLRDPRLDAAKHFGALDSSTAMCLAISQDPLVLCDRIIRQLHSGLVSTEQKLLDDRYASIPVRYSSGETDLNECYGPDQVLSITGKYTSVWGEKPARRIPPPKYLSAVTELGGPPISQYRSRVIESLWAHPLAQRLQYVRQLSTVPQLIHLDASHSRLAHSFGTVDLAAYALVVLIEKVQDSDCAVAQTIKSNHALWLAFLLSAGCHDLFHGPLGHSLDAISNLLFGVGIGSERKVDKLALRAELNRIDPARVRNIGRNGESAHALWDLSFEVAGSNTDGSKVFEYVAAILGGGVSNPRSLAVQKRLGVSECAILSCFRELLDGSVFDIDRLDYIYRDLIHLGWRHTLPEPKSVIDALTVVVSDEKLSASFDESHVVELSSWRKKLYREVYEAEPKQGFDAMIQRALYWFIETEFGGQPALTQGAAKQILCLSDDELFHLFYELGGKERHQISWALVKRTVLGRGIAPIREWRCRQSSLQVIARAQVAALPYEVDASAIDPIENRSVVPYSEEWLSNVARRAACTEEEVVAVLVAQFVNTTQPSFARKAEQVVWDTLLSKVETAVQVREFLSETTERFSDTSSDEMRSLIQDKPLICLVPTWDFRESIRHDAVVTEEEIPILRSYAPAELIDAGDVLKKCMTDGSLLRAITESAEMAKK